MVFIYGFGGHFIAWQAAGNSAGECGHAHHRYIAGLMDGYHRCGDVNDPTVFAGE